MRQLSDAAGNVTDSYWYTAFGEELASSGTTENAFRYAGEEFDPNTAFYYLRARWMSPSTGRFVGVDPWAGDKLSPPTLHRYLYANGSPAQHTDPSGLMTLLEVTQPVAIAGILNIASKYA
ncbi:MAG: hypothetical protein GF331_01900 [Chitinivibrionales bacterium]|nr:hypothetical protein [Chitinivibrionales bacterium]